jgi:hypothetical protein
VKLDMPEIVGPELTATNTRLGLVVLIIVMNQRSDSRS